MANADILRGFIPSSGLSGQPYNASVETFSTASGDSVAIGMGDPVKLVGTSQTINGEILADVAQAATGDVIVGVCVGVLPDTRDSLTYRAASTVRRVLVETNPNLVFEIQEVSGGTALTANDIGLNANFVAAVPSTVTGYSAFELNNATEATTNTLDVQIVGFVNRTDNAIGENAKWLVRINRHQFANQVAGV
jgi:hypothetical protein